MLLRLMATASPPIFDVVMHQPEIPNNTGNIGRTCVATGCALRLIHPLGFDTSEKAFRRAGLDYWPRLAPIEHDSWRQYLETGGGDARRWCFSTKAARPIWEVDLRPGDHFIFGRETAGLPDDILAAHPDSMLALPMAPGERSLNVATAVCAVIYEGLRQCVARRDLSLSADARLDF